MNDMGRVPDGNARDMRVVETELGIEHEDCDSTSSLILAMGALELRGRSWVLSPAYGYPTNGLASQC